jgi:predicted RNA-binding Zn-ribbon protein involved in translation (DUF1610 family)
MANIGTQMNILTRALLAVRYASIYSAPMPDAPTKFLCPNCDAEFKLIRVEAAPTHDRQLTCLSCGAPLRNRVGKFALKYFRVSDGAELGRRNGRRPNF